MQVFRRLIKEMVHIKSALSTKIRRLMVSVIFKKFQPINLFCLDDQKSDSKDYFSSSYMSTELDVDGSLDTLFASQKKESLRKSSLKANISAKRDALLKKITEWHEDKNASLDESTKKKHVKILIDDLLGSATIHRITFK